MMKFACPNCAKHQVRLRDPACPECGFPLTVGSLLRHYRRRLVAFVAKVTQIQCPGCREPIPLRTTTCPHCQTRVTFKAAAKLVLGPFGRRWQSWQERRQARSMQQARQTAPSRRGIYLRLLGKLLLQAAYLTLSIMAFIHYLPELNKPKFDNWFWHGLLTIIYASSLGAIVLLVVPHKVLAFVSQRTGMLVKLGIIANVFTLLILLQVAFDELWAPAAALAVIQVLLWIALWVLGGSLWPVVTSLRDILRDREGSNIDPTKPQGRDSEMD